VVEGEGEVETPPEPESARIRNYEEIIEKQGKTITGLIKRLSPRNSINQAEVQ
jgi:hypothetical protein